MFTFFMKVACVSMGFHGVPSFFSRIFRIFMAFTASKRRGLHPVGLPSIWRSIFRPSVGGPVRRVQSELRRCQASKCGTRPGKR